MIMLPPETLHKITDILTPHVGSETSRRALVIDTFGAGHRLVDLVDYSGAAHPFVVSLITKLNNYGEIAPGKPALSALLDTVKLQVGVDQAALIDSVKILIGKPVDTSPTEHPLVRGDIEDNSSFIKTTERELSAQEYHVRGMQRHEKGDFEGAYTDWSTAIRVNPIYFPAYNNRGNLNLEKGNYEAAIADYRQALALNPTFVEAHMNLGSAYLKKGDVEAAFAEYEKALRLNPKDARLYNNRGAAYSTVQNHADAIADYTKAIFLDSQNVDAYHNRGMIHHMMGNIEDAITDYNKAIKHDSQHFDTYRKRGDARLLKSDIRGALADYQEYLDLGGGRHNGDQSQIEKLIQLLRPFLGSSPNSYTSPN